MTKGCCVTITSDELLTPDFARLATLHYIPTRDKHANLKKLTPLGLSLCLVAIVNSFNTPMNFSATSKNDLSVPMDIVYLTYSNLAVTNILSNVCVYRPPPTFTQNVTCYTDGSLQRDSQFNLTTCPPYSTQTPLPLAIRSPSLRATPPPSDANSGALY
jgi:hypothetical protein